MTIKLLSTINKNTLKEEATGGATSAGAVSSFAMPLFTRLIKRTSINTEKPKEKLHKKTKNKKLSDYFATINEAVTTGAGIGADPSYDKTETISRLKSLERKETIDKNETQSYGLEDENHNIIRITIKKEQAPQFEKALEQFLAVEENERKLEIAEILFKLKDRFDIVDVDWPNIEEDEEEKQELAMPEEQPFEKQPEEKTQEIKSADINDAKSLLQQVIDMMKADADARKAEAMARQKEAEAKTTEAAAQQAMARVKREEQLLDMEEWERAKKEQEKEAKRLAKLAHWKREMEKEKGIVFDEIEPEASNKNNEIETDYVSSSLENSKDINPKEKEEEETTFASKTHKFVQQKTNKQIRPSDITSFILNGVK